MFSNIPSLFHILSRKLWKTPFKLAGFLGEMA
jgi:hypothetical protein